MTYGVHLLAFGAHPDDVELFCGGIVIRAGELGHTTGAADLTRGERASRGTPAVRAREAETAAGELGLGFRDNAELPDTELAAVPAQIARVVAILRRRRPEIVLAPWREDRHPDHVAASALITQAVMFAGVAKYAPDAGEPFAPRQLLYYAMRHRMTPSFVVDTSSAVARKQRAIACYASQLAGSEGPPTLIGSRDAIAAIDARDRYYGTMIGTTHGEPLRAAAVPGLVDPVRHFRDNPFTGAHAFEDPS